MATEVHFKIPGMTLVEETIKSIREQWASGDSATVHVAHVRGTVPIELHESDVERLAHAPKPFESHE